MSKPMFSGFRSRYIMLGVYGGVVFGCVVWRGVWVMDGINGINCESMLYLEELKS